MTKNEKKYCYNQHHAPNTHTYANIQAYMRIAIIAPAFTLSFHDSELKISEANAPASSISIGTPNAHSLSR